MTNTDSTDNAPERIWADTDGVWREFDPSDFKTVVGEYVRADLAPDPLGAVKIKPLVWYGKPEGQEQRIGRCGQIAYAVRFRKGCWGYTRHGDRGHVVSYKGGPIFNDEVDAINGADIDHETRIRSALEPCDPLADPRVVALVDVLSRIKNYAAHSPMTQAELNIAAWASAALAAFNKGGKTDG